MNGRSEENLRVVVRCRDVQHVSDDHGDAIGLEMDMAANRLTLLPAPHYQFILPKEAETFTPDAVYDDTVCQREIFLREVRPLVDGLIDGYNATVIAYGALGSGKTHTLMGCDDVGDDDDDEASSHGVMPRGIHHLFHQIRQKGATNSTATFRVRVSCIELYKGHEYDLLSNARRRYAISVNRDSDLNSFVVEGAQMPEFTSAHAMLRRFRRVAMSACQRRRDHSDGSRCDDSDRMADGSRLFVIHLEKSRECGRTCNASEQHDDIR